MKLIPMLPQSFSNNCPLFLIGKIRFTLIVIILILLGSMGVYAQDSSVIYYNSGIQKFNSRLYNAASLDFDKAIKLNSNYTEAYIANGKVNLEMNRIYQANEYFTKANELKPGDKEVIVQLMNIQFDSRKNEEAIKLANQCGCEEASRIIGISYYRMEDYGKAAEWLQKALKKNNKDADATYALGQTYLELEKDQDAISWFEKAVNLNPKNYNWQYELSLLYYNSNRYADAVKSIESALAEGYPKSNDVLENLGFCQLYSGDVTNGMKNLNTVLSHKPDNVTLLTNIAYAMYSTKRYEGAIEFYGKVLSVSPKDAISMYMAGMAFQKMGQKEKGQAICDKAIEMDPSLAKNRQKKEMPMGL